MKSSSSRIPLPVQIILTVALLVVGVIGGLITLLYLIFMGYPAILQLLLLLTGGVLILFAVLKVFDVGKRKLNLTFLAVILALLLSAGGIQAYRIYDHSIPTVNAEVDLWEYVPYREQMKDGPMLESKLISREKATLQLETELPRLDGATALYPIYAAAVEAVYPERDYGSPYSGDGTVVCNTTPVAYERLIQGETDLIFALSPSQKQLQTAKEQGVELELTPIGREAFVFFVNGGNPVENLTLSQIREIYSGKITNWKDVGGRAEDIRAFQRPEGSGSQTALQKLMGDTGLMEPTEQDVLSGMGEIIQRTSDYKNYTNAIGYSFRFFATEMAANDQIRLLKVDGVYPDKETVRDGSYPIVQEFCIVSRKGSETENMRRLKEWFLTSEGQALIERSGYLPL